MSIKAKKGFTLIELLVVIAIIALLLSILVPSLSKVKEQAKNVTCSSNLHQQGVSLSTYASQHDTKYPPKVHDYHLPFGGMRADWDTLPFRPAGQAALVVAGYLEPTFIYCPAMRRGFHLTYEEQFIAGRQDNYLKTRNVADIDFTYLYIGYSYLVDWEKGRREQGNPLFQNITPRIAKKSTDHCSKITVADNVLTLNTANPDVNLGNRPHALSGHQVRNTVSGGNYLHNDGSVEWKRVPEMEQDRNKYLHRTYAYAEIDFWF